ncbi:MAG: alpha/beta hydrolase [Candidatus Gribaldobacteria bacterium]|nr:alpha/beta hydrolase [Candidatus Gribaldobacteria bacterium]
MDTLIILHGWQSSKEKWQKVKELLEGPDLKVVALDLPGFKPENQLSRPWNLNDYVAWLENLLTAYREPVYLLGHSFGGRIAIKLAAKNPEKLKGLILVAAAGIKRKKTIKDRFLLKIVRLAKKLGVQEQSSDSQGAKELARKIFYCYILRRTDYFKANPLQKEIMKNALEEDLTRLLPTINKNTLIIWGKKDTFTPIKNAYLMKEKIKNSRLEVLPKNGHSLHLQCPEELAQKIKNFIGSTSNHGTNN